MLDHLDHSFFPTLSQWVMTNDPNDPTLRWRKLSSHLGSGWITECGSWSKILDQRFWRTDAICGTLIQMIQLFGAEPEIFLGTTTYVLTYVFGRASRSMRVVFFFFMDHYQYIYIEWRSDAKFSDPRSWIKAGSNLDQRGSKWSKWSNFWINSYHFSIDWSTFDPKTHIAPC